MHQGNRKSTIGTVAAISLMARAASVGIASPATPQLQTLYSFHNTSGTQSPQASLVADAAGNLYGTTNASVFELTGVNHQTMTTLVTFTGLNGGYTADTPLVGIDGNIYGVTANGNINHGGTVFELSGLDHQTLTILQNFNQSGGGPYYPLGGLVQDKAGNLYGNSQFGGTSNAGSIFKLSGISHQTFTLLASFTVSNGNHPTETMAFDAAGNLWGTTTSGPTTTIGAGTVYELSLSGSPTLTAAVNFSDVYPYAIPIFDASGNLYGTTQAGGPSDNGTVFEMSGAGLHSLTTLAAFNGSNGSQPWGGVIADAAGNLFGTTKTGGTFGDGTVFELSGPNHQTLTTLYNFDGTTGAYPVAGLFADAAGNLYGTTSQGGTFSGTNGGTVFELTGTGFVVPEPTGLPLLAVVAGLVQRRVGRRREKDGMNGRSRS